jgi:MarR family transcriptional repressor of emrRAB
MNQMSDSFRPFEAAIHRASQRVKGMPAQEVLLTKLFQHVASRLTDYHDGLLKVHGVNHTEWSALVMLYASESGSLKPSELSAYMDSSRTNITRVADELVERGWVERCPCGEDRRQVYLRLTKAGYAFLEPLLPTQRERHRRLWASFTKAEMQTMEGLLRKLLKQLGG